MKERAKQTLLFVFLLSAALAFWNCSEDNPTDGNGGIEDSTPPGVDSVRAVNNTLLEVYFDEAVDKTSAERTENYSFIKSSIRASASADNAPAAWGDTLSVVSITLQGDEKTASVFVEAGMGDTDYDFTITGVKDLYGNTMTAAATGTFAGTQAGDNTPPEVVSRSPQPNETGVGLQQSVVVEFSEPMRYSDMVSAYSWSGGGGPVPADVDVNGNVYVFRPLSPMATGTTYTFALTDNARDMSGNPLTPTSWQFTTTSNPDQTPPSLVSSTPADGAINVPVGTNFVLRFSERINQQRELDIIVTPDPGDGAAWWSGDGTTVTFNPDEDLEDNTKYTVVMPQGAVEDMSGNLMQESVTIRFTTASSFPQGRISGTVSGDPLSSDASDPEGAVVLASTVFLFDTDDPVVDGTAFVDADSNYSVAELPDGDYYLVALMDSNDDGELNPETGDAAGVYGFNPPGDFDPNTVSVIGGNHVQDVDFRLWDFSVISGNVFYNGTDYINDLYSYPYYVGLFDTTGFDPVDPGDPDYGDGPFSVIWEAGFYLGGLDGPIADGTYYVGAYMDINPLDVDGYNPDVDPAGIYMSGDQPVPVTVENGSDRLGVVIYLEDADGGGAMSGSWTIPPSRDTYANRQAQRLFRILKNAADSAKLNRQKEH